MPQIQHRFEQRSAALTSAQSAGPPTVASLPTIVVAIVGVVAALLAWTATPAAAHSDLVSSSPANGDSLGAPPVNVELTFNESILDAGTQVVATGPQGAVDLGVPTVAGPTVSAVWPPDAPAGDYSVAYRVVSADGHPIDGTVNFSYQASADAAAGQTMDRGQSAVAGDPPPAGSDSTGAASDVPTSVAPVPTDNGATAPGDVVTPSPDPASQSQDGGGFPWWLGVLVVIGGVGIGGAIARRMSSRKSQ